MDVATTGAAVVTIFGADLYLSSIPAYDGDETAVGSVSCERRAEDDEMMPR